MITPKEFYRKLDSLLSKINMAQSGTDFLLTIVNDLSATFGSDLRIGQGCIYEENGDIFSQVSPLSQFKNIDLMTNLSINSIIVQSVLNSKTYIFDTLESRANLLCESRKDYAIPVGITINDQEHNWIIIFELKSGWVREEIEFCLNAVRALLNYRLQSESIKNEYEQAYLIQKSLLPITSPKIQGYQISGVSKQAELVGGDIFDYYKFNDDEFGFCIGDASGHGIPAALMARDAIIGLRMGLENQMKMAHTLKKLNRVIYQSTYSAKFISLFYGEIELDGTLFYVNAGHPPPLLLNKNEVLELESTGLVFGALPEIDLRRSYIKILPGSILVLYTDGIVERQNNAGEEFGLLALKDVIIRNSSADTDKILTSIFSAADDFGKKTKWKDDATVVVIKRIV